MSSSAGFTLQCGLACGAPGLPGACGGAGGGASQAHAAGASALWQAGPRPRAAPQPRASTCACTQATMGRRWAGQAACQGPRRGAGMRSAGPWPGRPPCPPASTHPAPQQHGAPAPCQALKRHGCSCSHGVAGSSAACWGECSTPGGAQIQISFVCKNLLLPSNTCSWHPTF